MSEMAKCSLGCRTSGVFILLLFLSVFVCASVASWSDGLDRELYRRPMRRPAPADWFSRAAGTNEDGGDDDDDDEMASFGSMLKRRRVPFRSDLGKRFLRPRYTEEEAEEQHGPLVYRDNDDDDHLNLWPELEDGAGETRGKRYRYFKADLGKRSDRYGALRHHRRHQSDGFRQADFRGQGSREEFERDMGNKRRMFRSDLG